MRVEYRLGKSPDALGDLPNDSVDLVLMDPPYGTGNAPDHQYGRRQRWGVDHGTEFIANDTDLSELAKVLPEMRRLLQPAGLLLTFAAPSKRREVIKLIEASGELWVFETIPWDKGAPGISHKFRWCQEDIHIVTRDEGLDIWAAREPLIVPLRVPRVRKTQHPNEKPVALYRRLIEWALPIGGFVLDPFAGIASCGLAAIAQQCDYVGVECDEQWFPIGERRLAEAQGKTHHDLKQNDLFSEDPAA